jgi:hypothetical protein
MFLKPVQGIPERSSHSTASTFIIDRDRLWNTKVPPVQFLTGKAHVVVQASSFPEYVAEKSQGVRMAKSSGFLKFDVDLNPFFSHV